MKDAKGHGSNPRGGIAHQSGVTAALTIPHIWNQSDRNVAALPMDKNGAVTLYRAAAKFPSDTYAKGTYFATDAHLARYYAESHYPGEPSDISVRSLTVDRSLIQSGGAGGAFTLREDHPVNGRVK